MIYSEKESYKKSCWRIVAFQNMITLELINLSFKSCLLTKTKSYKRIYSINVWFLGKSQGTHKNKILKTSEECWSNIQNILDQSPHLKGNLREFTTGQIKSPIHTVISFQYNWKTN